MAEIDMCQIKPPNCLRVNSINGEHLSGPTTSFPKSNSPHPFHHTTLSIISIYIPLPTYTNMYTSFYHSPFLSLCRNPSPSSLLSLYILLGKKNMPIISSSSGVSLKVAVVSTCVLSVGVMMLKHYSVQPLISDFVASDVPSFWNILLQWLKPPYLYIVINGIIISIVASSKLQQKYNDDHHQYYPSPYVQSPEEKVIIPSEVSVYDHHHHVQDFSENKKMVGDLMMDGGDVVPEVEKHVTTPLLPQRSDSMEFSDSYEKENIGKPPVSARFGQRKALKASPEGGKALRVSKSKRSDTLESTWKTITEGRAMPLTRHLKKSDTWESHVRQNTPPSSAPELNKHSSSDNENANSGRLRREPSPSQDELNRRVEAFIKKFNEEMRLQRQRSLEQYNQMINGGAN